MMKRLCQALCLIHCALLLSCSDKDDLSLSEVVTQTENPPVYLYIEDTDGRDLTASGLPIRVWTAETGLPLDYRVEPGLQPLPWGGEGRLLTVTPAAPYHDADDPEYTYTLNTTTYVTVGEMHPVSLSRLFDYDLKRYTAGDGGRAVNVSYTPSETNICGGALQGDTTHIIVEAGSPSMRVEGDELTVEIRLDIVDDSLASLPLTRGDDGVWKNGLLQFRLLFSGRTIARPHETVTVSNHHTDDNEYLAVEVKLRLPYIYDGSRSAVTNFSFDYLLTSPTVFGNDWEHSVSLAFYDWVDGKSIRFTDMYLDGKIVYDKPTLTAGNPSLVIDWRELSNQSN